MKLPATPPNPADIIGKLGTGSKGIKRILQIAMAQFGPAPDHQYRHWDTLRHVEPPEGFTVEEWWLGIRMARQSLSRTLPIRDGNGQPFSFTMTDPGLYYLRFIDSQASGAIDSPKALLSQPERERHIKRSQIEEAIQSSRVEGAATTRAVAKKMLTTERKPRDRSDQMILNNYNAMQFIGRIKHEALTPAMILELQRILTHDTLDDHSAAGRFRRPDEQITVVDRRDNEELHIPPDASELHERVQQLCNFANQRDDLSPNAIYFHPVVRSILLHFWLAYDPPFVDGNGRTARALFYWSMAHRGYWLCEYLTISAILTKAPTRFPPPPAPGGPQDDALLAPRLFGRHLPLVHGYCSSGSIWPAADFTAPKQEFLDPNQNRTHDQFANLLLTAVPGRESFGVVAHSQGGPAGLHLYTYYWSGLDRAQGPRLIQSVASPYQGTPLASLGSFACGVNNDMTPSGAATWLAGIPTWARAKVWYWTTSDAGSA